MNGILKLILNLVLAVIAVALTLVILFFMNPSWQQSLVERVLEEDTARRWQVGEIEAMPLGIEARDVFVLDGEVGAEAQYVQLRGPLWKLPVLGVLEVHSGEISGLSIDLSGLRIGDPTSSDYQKLLKRVSSDAGFWEERFGLVLGKLAATGVQVRISDLEVGGRVLMPGDQLVPVRWTIVSADSSAPRLIEIVPTGAGAREL